jgi:hypothetical protein
MLPKAKLVLLSGVGHMPHHARPDAVTAAIEELALAEQSDVSSKKKLNSSRLMS